MTVRSGRLPIDLGHDLFSAMESGALERRSALRIAMPFPATVRGVGRDGRRFGEHTHLGNLSAAGLYVWLHRQLEPGALLFVVARLTLDEQHAERAAGVAVKGVVLRAEAHADGTWGYAVLFVRHRFLFVGRV